MVFLDGSSLYWGIRNYNQQNGTDLKIDYDKLVSFAVGKRSLVRATFYCGVPASMTDTQANFIHYLRKSGIQVFEKEIKVREEPTGQLRAVEKGVDVSIAVDLLGMAWENAFDVAVLVSGDGDLVGAVSKVMNKGKNVEVLSFRGSCSSELSKAAIRTTYIDDIVDAIRRP